MIKLLLVDDQMSVRYGLRLRLALEPDLVVVGEASDGVMALTLVNTLQPDVVLIDIEMPGLDGLAVTTSLQATRAPCAVVILTLHDDDATQAQAYTAGAAGFVAKQAGDAALVAAIRNAVQRKG